MLRPTPTPHHARAGAIRASLAAAIVVGSAGQLVTAPGAAAAAPGATRSGLPAPTELARAHHVGYGGAVPGWTNQVISQPAPGGLLEPAPAPGSQNQVASTTVSARTTARGIDVSAYSGAVDWAAFARAGTAFDYVKATEGLYYANPLRGTQRDGATAHGLLVGSYHFANPAGSTAKAQADFFVAHGGGNGTTTRRLPGAVDLEWNPYAGNACYGLSRPALASWVSAFQGEYKKRTGRYPVIYTARTWWSTCIGSGPATARIASRSPLWVSSYTRSPGTLPTGWSSPLIWQNGTHGAPSYDTDLAQGGRTRLLSLAR